MGKLTIDVTANVSKRTFTIRKKDDGKTYIKYRTIKLSKDEFYSMETCSSKEWRYFLEESNDYYKVK